MSNNKELLYKPENEKLEMATIVYLLSTVIPKIPEEKRDAAAILLAYRSALAEMKAAQEALHQEASKENVPDVQFLKLDF